MILILNRNGSITKKIWNGKKRKNELKPMQEMDVLAYLMEPVELAKGFTVRDYFKVVQKYKMLQLLDHYFEPYLEELKKCPAKGCAAPDMKSIEVHKYVTVNFEKDAYVVLDVSGIAKKKDEHGNIHYGVDFMPLSKMLDLPITFGKMGIHSISMDKKKEFNYKYPTSYTLWDLIRGFIWEISFYGVPQERDAQKDELMKRVEEVENGTAKLIPYDEVKKKLTKMLKKKKGKKGGK
jgi:hypothetical protein